MVAAAGERDAWPMLTSSTDLTPAGTVRQHLEVLEAERATAHLARLDSNSCYMEDLLAEIERHRIAYVGLAVTELATLRGELSGRPQG
jgi:hypothetical protein